MSSTNFNIDNCDKEFVNEINCYDVKEFKLLIKDKVKNYINFELIKNKMNVYKKPLLIKDNKREPKNTVYNQRHIRDLIFEYVGENPYKKYDVKKVFIKDNIYDNYKNIENLDIIKLHKLLNNDWYKNQLNIFNSYDNCFVNCLYKNFDLYDRYSITSSPMNSVYIHKRLTVNNLRKISKEIFNTKNSKMKKQELLHLLFDRNNTKNLWWYYENGIELKTVNIKMVIMRQKRGIRFTDKDDKSKQKFIYQYGNNEDELNIEIVLKEGEEL